MSEKKQILLVAQASSLIETVQKTLEGSSFQVVYCLGPQDEWIQACIESKPDFCIFAPQYDVPHCFHKIQDLHALNIKTRCLIICEKPDIPHARTAFSSGAFGYLISAYVHSDLQNALLQINNNHLFCKTDEIQNNTVSSPKDKVANLSDREVEVLQLIAYGYTYQDIAEKINVSVKSVETYRSRISKKLDLDTRAKMVRFALDHNLLTKDQHP